MSVTTGDSTGLFSLPPELRLRIYSYIPLPNRGWFDVDTIPCDIRWLLADRKIFADAAPHCNAKEFSTSLQLPLAPTGRMSSLWDTFTRTMRGRFGGQAETPGWLVADASVTIKVVSASIMLPYVEGDSGWSDCPPQLALETVQTLMRGIDRFCSLENLRVHMIQSDLFERQVASGRNRLKGEKFETMAWAARPDEAQELQKLVPGSCTVQVDIAEFASVAK